MDPMQYIVIPAVALLASGLTLFSGFGLGTLLMPAFALFFPVDLAVALTAIVHFLNNLFKLWLLGKHAHWGIVLRFGIPAIFAALAGAGLLLLLSQQQPLMTYRLGGREFDILWVKLIVAVLMIAFALIEVLPRLAALQCDRKYLPVGGIISGFFGGLSGNQGAMRSAFLIRCGLDKEAFVATGVIIACLVDVSRLSVYAAHWRVAGVAENTALLIVATFAAFLGAFIGNRLLKKTTLKMVQLVVSAMLMVIAVGLAAGVI